MTSREAPTLQADSTDRVAAGPAAPQRDFSWAVYGSLLVTTLLVVESQAIESPDFIGLSIVISIGVFWIAHAWAEIVGLRVRGPISLADVGRVVRDQATILAAAIAPVAVLLLRHTSLYPIDTAITLALIVSLVQLFIWGIVVGRAARVGWTATFAIAVIDFALGLVVVGLKVVAIH
ncbi:MAG: hypothetical protein ACHQ3P_00460 [Candidatus Limnocylindrales bacterium]